MHKPRPLARLVAFALLLASAVADAADGKLLLTGGVTSIDGAAGGGLTPWAVTASHAASGELGATAHATRVRTQDYALSAFGASLTWHDRVEVSLARQEFDTGPTGAALGLPGLRLAQTIAGAKLRVAGDAVLDSDTLMPQIAVGLLHKRAKPGALRGTLEALGARLSDSELYVSATKLLLAQSTLVNATLRATRANQNGLLGFGGTNDNVRLYPELSVALLLRRDLAIGAEYRAKPDNLNPSPLGSGLAEDDWADVFIAWAPSKRLSLTLAFVDLGRIVPAVVDKRQTGGYLSLQVSL